VGLGKGLVAQEMELQSQSRGGILVEDQESERNSARAAIGLNEAQVELKSQRRSWNKKRQGRCSEPCQHWPKYRIE
jgi:hypothetical protein